MLTALRACSVCLLRIPAQWVHSQRTLECVEGRKVGAEGLYDPLMMESEMKGRPQQISSYRAGDETEGISSQEQ